MSAEERKEGRPHLVERLRERRDAHKERGRAYRAAFGAAGVLVLLAGVVLSLPLVPGPGFVLVAIGLGMLALEFAWAENLLEKILERVEDVGERAGKASPLQKAAVAALAVAGVAALVAAAMLWDLPVVPV